jgi:flagellar biosynthetic protein FliP
MKTSRAISAGALLTVGLVPRASWADTALPSMVGPTSAVQLAVILTVITLAPAIVLSCTTFARFIIVFSFLKMGLGTPGAPPNQIITGLALFMTLFVMAPVAEEIQGRALTPYLAGQIGEAEALERATPPLRAFLLSHCDESDLALFYEVTDLPRPDSVDAVPLRFAIPAFALSELRTAFQMGFLVLLPFLIIDLVVATVLSSLGMVMLPPAVVALPIKLMVFVAADGWRLVVGSLLRGAYG